MKFFNKKAFTLTELIASIIILTFMFTAIIMFLSSSVNVMVDTDKQTNISGNVFNLKKVLDEIKSKGYRKFQIIDSENNYDTVIFSDSNLEKGIVLGVVDSYKLKLKTKKTYGNNYIGYRYLNEKELNDIMDGKSKVDDIKFLKEKVLNLGIVRDFKTETYEGKDLLEPVLDINFSIISSEIKGIDGTKFEELNISKKYIYNYNLVF